MLNICKFCVPCILFPIILAGCAESRANLLIEKRCHELNEAYMCYNFPRKFHAHARPIEKKEIAKIIEQCYDNTKYASAGDIALGKIISEQLNISYLLSGIETVKLRLLQNPLFVNQFSPSENFTFTDDKMLLF